MSVLKEKAVYCKEKISEKLGAIGLEYNRKKTKIFKASDGIYFL